VTALAGLRFLINPETHFFPRVVPIVGWLLLRSFILAAALAETRGSVRRWTAISAGLDFLLAVLLIAGLSITTIVISLFGPTRELVASFAWILAASFVVNGLMLLEVASCERDAAA
jgi:predicted membrane channel-forming protein YqfA (hemolysin III family)